jgi:protein disulfide-isomerase
MRFFLLSLAALLALCASAGAAPRWLTNFDAAQQRARAEGKLLLVDFTGSDWCPTCMHLEREVFSTVEFARYAQRHLVLMKADFPRTKALTTHTRKQNQRLAQRFAVRFFPTIVVLDSRGRQVSTLGYVPGGVEAFIAALPKLDSAEGAATPAVGSTGM